MFWNAHKLDSLKAENYAVSETSQACLKHKFAKNVSYVNMI